MSKLPIYARPSVYLAGFGSLFGLVTLLNCFTIVDGGHVGVVRRLGAIQEVSLPEGFHGKLPYVDSVTQEDTRTKPVEAPIAAASKDLQDVTTKVTVTYSLVGSKSPLAFRLIGDRNAIRAALLDNGVQQSAKAVISGFTVEELVTQRELVRSKVEDQLRAFITESLKQRGLEGYLQLNSVAITDFGFSEKFAAAIEAKSTADQERLQALIEKQKQITQAEAEAAKQKTLADAKAYQLKVESQAEADAVNRVMTSLGRGTNYSDYLRAKAMQDRWNGQLPVVTGGNSLVTLDQLGAAAKAKADGQ